jgi:cytoskeletal protein CcmA (bactofilin family)
MLFVYLLLRTLKHNNLSEEYSIMAKLLTIIETLLVFNLSSSAMVIHNDGCEKNNTETRSESGTFNEDYLFLGHELRFSGQAEDLIFLGKELAFSGTTKLGLISLGKNLFYSGTSGNGMIGGGINILVDGTINGNSYVGCKSFKLSDKGSVNGNLFIGCARLTIDGPVKGNLYIAAGEIVLNSHIDGNVTVYGGRLIIGEKGTINGNLTYGTKEKLGTQESQRVTGTITYDETHRKDMNDWNSFVKITRKIGFFIAFAMFISYIITGTVLLFLPAFRKLDTKISSQSFWRTSLWGLIPVLMYPALIVACFILIVTIPFAFVLILACIPLFFFAHLIGTTLVGKYIVMKFKWNVPKRHVQFLIGALAAVLISWIPVINFLVFLFISSLGWGTYLSFIFNRHLTETAPEQNDIR